MVKVMVKMAAIFAKSYDFDGEQVLARCVGVKDTHDRARQGTALYNCYYINANLLTLYFRCNLSGNLFECDLFVNCIFRQI
jgi:hypothetical protein